MRAMYQRSVMMYMHHICVEVFHTRLHSNRILQPNLLRSRLAGCGYTKSRGLGSGRVDVRGKGDYA